MKPIACFPGLAMLAVVAVIGCQGTPTCSSDADCPTGSTCDVELAACFASSPVDSGTDMGEPDAGSGADAGPEDAGNPDAGEPDAGMPTFAVRVTPEDPEVVQGESVQVQVAIERIGGFAEDVSVTLGDMPSGMSASALVIDATSSSGTVTVATTGDTPVGPANVLLRAVGGAQEQQSTLLIAVKPSPVLTVDITSPAADISTNGIVSVQLSVTGGTPDQMELLVDGQLQTLMFAPWQYQWHTNSVPEGEHVLSARATKAGRTYTSPIRKIVVDRTAPTVVTRMPAPGATNAPVGATISATFSEPIAPATVTPSSVSLTSGSAAVPNTISLSQDRKTLTITPSSAPVPTVTWTVTLNGVTDPAGNALQMPSSPWTFTYPAWLPIGGALSAVGGTTLAEKPQLQIDPMGQPVVAWIESDGAEKNVYVRRWNGTQWQALGTKLSAYSGTGSHAENVSLALDAAGNPVVVWVENDGTSDALHARRWIGSTWSVIGANVTAGVELSLTAISLVVEAAGNPIVMWHEYPAGELKVVRWTGASWSAYLDPTAALSATGAYNCWDPSLALDNNGALLAAFTCATEPVDGQLLRSVYISRWTGSAWQPLGTAIRVSGHSDSRYPSLRTSSSGTPFVAWSSTLNSTSHSAYGARWTGLAWQQLGSNLNWNAGDAQDVTLAISPSGAATAAWSGAFPGTRKIGVSSWGTTTWSTLGTTLEADSVGSTVSIKPSIAFDANGVATVAFQEGTTTAGDVYVFRLNK